MSKPESIYMWYIVDKAIKRIESRIDLISKTTDLYDPQYCYIINKYCSIKYSHITGEFVPMKKTHDFMYGFKSQCISINGIFSKFKGCLHSRRKNKSKKFPPISNKLLPHQKYHLDRLPYYVSNETEESL